MTDPDFIDKLWGYLERRVIRKRLDIAFDCFMRGLIGFALACAVIQGR